MSEAEQRGQVFRLFCQKLEHAWIVHAGGEWLPAPLRPYFNQHLETSLVLLDFEYLHEQALARGATIMSRRTKSGSVALEARGRDAKLLAMWLGSAMASGLLAPRR